MKTRYALQALTQLAERPGSTVLIADLAQRGRIPRKFLEAILRELKQHGLLTSQRGRRGGYSLSLAAGEITLSSVVQALNGALTPAPFAHRAGHQPCEECRNGRACSVRLVLDDLHDATARVLEGTTLADLARRTHEARDPSPLKYAI